MKTMFRRVALCGLVVACAGLTTAVIAGPGHDHDHGDHGHGHAHGTKETTKQVELGEKVSDFTLTDLDGNEHSLSDFKDKYVVLEWTNPSCPYVKGVYSKGIVKDTINRMEAMGDDYVYIAVNSTANMPKEDVIKQNKDFLKEHSLNFPVLVDYDGTVGKMFGAKHTPDIFVLNKDHELIYFGGFTDDHEFKNGTNSMNYAVNALEQSSRGETVSPDTAKRWGCSVKYSRK